MCQSQATARRTPGFRRTRSDVLPVREAESVGDDRLRGEEVVGSSFDTLAGRLAGRKTDRPDAVRVPEGDESETSDHGRAGVGARALSHEVANSGEDVLLVDADLARLLEVVGEDVEEELRVRVGVDMPVGVRVEERP